MKKYKVDVELIASYSWNIEAKSEEEAIKKAEEETETELEKHGVMEYSLEGIIRK